jgi:hypothetical protein
VSLVWADALQMLDQESPVRTQEGNEARQRLRPSDLPSFCGRVVYCLSEICDPWTDAPPGSGALAPGAQTQPPPGAMCLRARGFPTEPVFGVLAAPA